VFDFAAMVGAAALVGGCYWGVGAGPTFATRRSNAKSGADSMMELGFVFDYERIVRVAYSGSLQLYHGALFTLDGQHVVAELPNSIQLEVTAYRLPQEVYLRPMARVYWGSSVRVGPDGAESRQPGSTLPQAQR
jgi:hypothetical protein